jgi:hypothetical protein
VQEKVRKKSSKPMTRLPRKVTTPHVMPSGTGYTVSMKSSKNMGTLLLMKMPTRMQEVYRVAVWGQKYINSRAGNTSVFCPLQRWLLWGGKAVANALNEFK